MNAQRERLHSRGDNTIAKFIDNILQSFPLEQLSPILSITTWLKKGFIFFKNCLLVKIWNFIVCLKKFLVVTFKILFWTAVFFSTLVHVWLRDFLLINHISLHLVCETKYTNSALSWFITKTIFINDKIPLFACMYANSFELFHVYLRKLCVTTRKYKNIIFSLQKWVQWAFVTNVKASSPFQKLYWGTYCINSIECIEFKVV